MSQSVLTLNHCCVSYQESGFFSGTPFAFLNPKKKVLHDITFSCLPQTITALVGPNGSGKSTLLQMINRFLPYDKGTIKLFGHKYPCNPSIYIGYAPDHTDFYPHLTGWEHCRAFATLEGGHDDQYIHDLFVLFGLLFAKEKKIGSYSKGMKQRLGLILSLLGDKPLIIWDEPMSGLDPLGRKCVADTMITLKQRGKTILFTTHVLTDVDQIADHFLLIFDGRLIDQGVMDGSFTMSERFHNAIVQPSQTRNII